MLYLDADEPALQENITEEGPGNDNDDEPSLEELLESVEKLSIDSQKILDTEGIIEDIEDAHLLDEFEEPEKEEQAPLAVVSSGTRKKMRCQNF